LPETGWGALNLLASIGAAILALGVLLFIVNVFWSRRWGTLAGANPWGADTLEWSLSSPPPDYNFYDIPVVLGRYALWSETNQTPVVKGLSTEKRETLVTSVLDAEPELRFEIPGPSIYPFLLALATAETFIVGIFTPWAFAVGAVLTFAIFVGWFFGSPNYENVTEKEPRQRAGTSEPPAQLRPEEA
jgi:hypothetical protein